MQNTTMKPGAKSHRTNAPPTIPRQTHSIKFECTPVRFTIFLWLACQTALFIALHRLPGHQFILRFDRASADVVAFEASIAISIGTARCVNIAATRCELARIRFVESNAASAAIKEFEIS